MKNQISRRISRHLYQATAVAASTLVISVALQNGAFQDAIYDGALTGGAMWASATSVGSFAQSTSVEHR
ncbi:hypothetical protein [Herminiimonas fonticola]|uniref:Uncharacterized protein n=1 Tax=Herminiimonas fonticola TaxID=303380 RepID=A0A4R6G1P1_9BURK|nr:hypothetical protein [Herminiimonas fonticola]RBA23479.1 hypothetical protein Hfont_2290 [Herminiimonas fonticola]TDN88266.1 hypothetical protein EV677_2753 [Herminiimonas fonticola]